MPKAKQAELGGQEEGKEVVVREDGRKRAQERRRNATGGSRMRLAGSGDGA